MANTSKPTNPAPADDAPPPVDTAPAAPEQAEAEQAAAPAAEPGRYRFTGPYAQTYNGPPSLVAEPGESYEWPAGPPADGRWIKEN